MLATLPERIEIFRYKGLNGTFPKIVWGEARVEQSYASNKACTRRTTVAIEYMTRDEDDPDAEAIMNFFNDAEMPFVCEIGYVDEAAAKGDEAGDPEGDYISYMFNLWLEEGV